jgi:hypothetical protein
MEFFGEGQKTLIFCVYTKTAEAIRDQLQAAVDAHLAKERQRVFGDASTFDNFRRRFFNRREPLFSMIQDHPLLGSLSAGETGVPGTIALPGQALQEIASVLVQAGEPADTDKPDRRLLLAAAEQVAVSRWSASDVGREWLARVLRNCPELQAVISDKVWLLAREPFSRSERGSRGLHADPEANRRAMDPLDAEFDNERGTRRVSRGGTTNSTDVWVARLRKDAIGEVIAPYFRSGVIAAAPRTLPLLAQHHADLLSELDLETRAMAGQVFRRILMAEEFLLRYLADVDKDASERWSDYLSERYLAQLKGHFESLKDRVDAYFETLMRGRRNKALLKGYHAAAENRNVVQLVKGGMDRDRYFLGFNTPYRPEILVSTQVGQEGIDLHRECRHIIHHDLCWNPATIEQRTGRVDRIGSKVERERLGTGQGAAVTLEIGVPYLAATYDERMFEELYRRAQLFEVTLGGEMRVDSRVEAQDLAGERARREISGIGTEDEDLGIEEGDTGTIALPDDMVERLRVDLSVWSPDRDTKLSPTD